MKDRSIVEIQSLMDGKLCDSVFSELLKMKLGKSEMHIGMTFLPTE